MIRNIRYFTPSLGARKVNYSISSERGETIYQTIERFSAQYKSSQLQSTTDAIRDIVLGKLINLHNLAGVSHLQTIQELMAKIKKGIAIFNLETNVPNVNLAKVGSDWVVINGHHTIMAYMFCGATRIAAMPYLIIEDADTNQIDTKEIIAVFGQYASKISAEHWKDKVLNWSASENVRLEDRQQKNMAELVDAFQGQFGAQLGLQPL